MNPRNDRLIDRSKKQRRAIVIASLGSGGAERVVSYLSRAWAEEGHQVGIFTWEAADTEPSYPMHPGLQIQGLDLARSSGGSRLRGLAANLGRAQILRKSLAAWAPDVVISFVDTTNIVACLAGLRAPWPTIVAERSDPATAPLPSHWRKSRRLLYPRAAAVITQTKSAMQYFAGRRLRTRAVIPNPVPPPRLPPAPMAEREQLVLAVGRLGPEKGFDRLITAFAQVAPSDWRLVIAGSGPLRQQLQEQIDDSGLTVRASLVGFITDLHRWYDRASIFCLSSHYEGFPNALCEAMAGGCAVLSYDCPSGPADIVQHQVDGLLAPADEPQTFANSLAQLMGDMQLRTELAGRARNLPERYSERAVLEKWDTLIRGVTS